MDTRAPQAASSSSSSGNGGSSGNDGDVVQTTAPSPVQASDSDKVPTMSGYLFKKSTNGEWQRRYFETNSQFLTYYKSQRMTKLLAALSLPQVGAIQLIGEVNDLKGQGFIFQLDLKDRQYILRTNTMPEAEAWVNTLIQLRDGAGAKAKSANIGGVSSSSISYQIPGPHDPPPHGTQPGGAFVKESRMGSSAIERCCVIA